MFAMRACRKSVMVGMHLTTGQMTSVTRLRFHRRSGANDMLVLGSTTYGHYGAAMELPSRKTHDATSGQFDSVGSR